MSGGRRILGRAHAPGRLALALAIALAVALAVTLSVACGRSDARAGQAAGARAEARAADTPRRTGSSATGGARAAAGDTASYRVVHLARWGSVSGRVSLGPGTHIPRDTIVPVIRDQARCGTSERVTLVAGRGDRVGEAIVWLDGVAAGKPLPDERRFTLTSERCALLPRVQAAIAGGMLNVRNRDPLAHRVQFTRDGATLDRVRETDAGQVVPTPAALARPGLVTAHCVLHAWAEAWIRVFDHPYFAMTSRDGTFHLDSVPPGTYRLRVWQPSLGTREQVVQVLGASGSTVKVTF